MNEVIVSTPLKEYGINSRLKTHNYSRVPDHALSIKQHLRLTDVLRQSGFSVSYIPEMPNHPNSVFTRDPAVCTKEGYIQLRMGLASRRGEEHWMSSFLEAIGISRIGSIQSPATAEGGDIIISGNTVFIGHSSRTNADGISQISDILRPYGQQIRVAEVPQPYLHLGGAMTVLAKDLILAVSDILPDNFFKGFNVIRLLAGNFISGNVISNRDGIIIAEEFNIEAIDKLHKAGLQVHALNLSEFVKGTGGPSCLVLPVKLD
jgi:dimethylargininase